MSSSHNFPINFAGCMSFARHEITFPTEQNDRARQRCLGNRIYFPAWILEDVISLRETISSTYAWICAFVGSVMFASAIDHRESPQRTRTDSYPITSSGAPSSAPSARIPVRKKIAQAKINTDNIPYPILGWENSAGVCTRKLIFFITAASSAIQIYRTNDANTQYEQVVQTFVFYIILREQAFVNCFFNLIRFFRSYTGTDPCRNWNNAVFRAAYETCGLRFPSAPPRGIQNLAAVPRRLFWQIHEDV